MSNQVELEQIKAMVVQLASRISAPLDLLPTYGVSDDMGRPHVEVDGRGYHLVVVEKGREQYRTTVASRDDLLFEIFRGVASSMGFDFELHQPKRDVDPRRVAFARALAILGALDKGWESRQKDHYDEVLLKSPLRA
ncbi:Imm63 family immunity protein [Paraburkholderia sp. CNPSo 3076]|uniref:Imm63 family immunity protein n=1 Tax=Paraburkholderia sp. CNPSo 3076 TaxID=2940936 RepID=UPI003A5221CD